MKLSLLGAKVFLELFTVYGEKGQSQAATQNSCAALGKQLCP